MSAVTSDATGSAAPDEARDETPDGAAGTRAHEIESEIGSETVGGLEGVPEAVLEDLPAPVVAEVRALDKPEEHKEPYRTLAVVAVAAGLLLVPALALLGHNRQAVLWLAAGVTVLAVVRLRRPTGTWIAARGRAFDVVIGLLLAVGLAALSYYAVLPSV